MNTMINNTMVQLFSNSSVGEVLAAGVVLKHQDNKVVVQFGVEQKEFTMRKSGDFVQVGERAEKGAVIRPVLQLVQKITEAVEEAKEEGSKQTKMKIAMEILQAEIKAGRGGRSATMKLFMEDPRLLFKKVTANTYFYLLQGKLKNGKVAA